MKIYVAERNVEYEGFDIIGVFSSREAASLACDNDKFIDGQKRGDRHSVSEWDLDEVLYDEVSLRPADQSSGSTDV